MSDLRDFAKWLETLKGMPTPENFYWSDYLRQTALQRRDHDQRFTEDMVRQQFIEQTAKFLDQKETRHVVFNEWVVPLELNGREPSISFLYGLNFENHSPLKLSNLSFKSLGHILIKRIPISGEV